MQSMPHKCSACHDDNENVGEAVKNKALKNGSTAEKALTSDYEEQLKSKRQDKI